MTSKIIHFTRHAQAEHNVDEDYDIPDAPLTKLGREQSAELNKITANTIQRTADLLVSSPLRRTLQTTIVGFPALRSRLESQDDPKPIIVLSRLQEVNDLPCDTGSDRTVLEKVDEFKGIDFSSLESDWNGKKRDFAPANVAARAKWVRKWLRARPEKEIVVVAHGDILRQITKTHYTHSWANAEVREYTFAAEDDEDADVVLVSKEARTGAQGPTSSELAN